MSEAKDSKPAKPIVDIAHPGKTAPPLTSRPVIVTNRAILKDPMMVDDSKSEPTDTPATEDPKPADKPKLDVKAGKVPVISHDADASDATAADDAPKPAAAAEKAPTDEPATEKNASSDVVTKDNLDDKEESTKSADGAQMTDAQLEAEAAADAKRDAALQKLIDSKKYYVPVNAVEKRRAKRITALGIALAIILALCWVDVALDAGIVQIGNVKPVTHFFSN